MHSDEAFLVGILAFIAGFILLFIVVGIIFYILYAIGMYKIAKTLGKEDIAFIAWIPIAQTFLIPILVENDVHKELRGKFTILYAVSWVISIVLGLVFTPFSFIQMIVLWYGFYVLAARFSKNALAHTIFSIVTLGLTMPISLFRFRNRNPIAVDEAVIIE